MGHEPLDDFMRIGMQDPASAPGAHPEPEVLLSYQAGELADAEAARVRQHVGVCRTCRQCVDDFAAIPELESEAAARTDADLEADWKDLMGRLRREGASVPAEHVPAEAKLIPFPTPAMAAERVRRPAAATTGARVWLALAATLALAAVGLGGWHLAQAPRGNIAVRDIAPERAMRRDERGPEWPRVVVPPGTERVVLLFPLVDKELLTEPPPSGTEAAPETTGSYRVEIAPEGKPAEPSVRRGRLVPDERTLSLELAPGALVAGHYQARVFAEGGTDPVAQYRFDLVYQ